MAAITPEHRSSPSIRSNATDNDPFNLTPTGSQGRGHRYSSFDTKLFSNYTRDSPTQTKRALEAHLADTDRRIQDASKLGTTLVEQKKEMAARLQEIEGQQPGSRVGSELRQKLDELEREYNEVGRETARQVIPNTPRQNTAETDGAAERLVLSATGRPTPSKPSAPSRKQRNGGTSHVQDIEFATEISTSLLAQVRQLQITLAEKEEELKKSNSETSRLQSQLEVNTLKIRGFDENEQRYKDDHWQLEVQVQSLITEIKDAASREQRLTQNLTTARTHQSTAENEYDELRLLHDKISQEHESLRRQHDTEVSGMQRSLATADAERESLQKKLEELKTQNEDLARAVAYRNRLEQDTEGQNSAFDDTMVDLAPTTPDHSPTGSPVKATPRHGALESETLKSSLHHAHRMIQNLKNNIHREKTERLELKRMLQEARDELEARKAEGSASAANAGRKRLPAQQGNFKKPVGLAKLGGAQRTQEEIINDPSWEEYENSPTRSRAVGHRGNYDPSTDASDAFETANERDSMATATTEGFQTGLESMPDSADELTETEESHGVRARGAAMARLMGTRRTSFESSASDDADCYDFSTPDPKQQPRYKLKVNRGPQARLYEQDTMQDSPASFTSDSKTSGPRQNLAAELDDLTGDNESVATSTPAHPAQSAAISPVSYIASPLSKAGSPQSYLRDETPIRFTGPYSQSTTIPQIETADAGTMTEEWPESDDLDRTLASSPIQTANDTSGLVANTAQNLPMSSAQQVLGRSLSQLDAPEVSHLEHAVDEKTTSEPRAIQLHLSSIATQYIEPISPVLKPLADVATHEEGSQVKSVSGLATDGLPVSPDGGHGIHSASGVSMNTTPAIDVLDASHLRNTPYPSPAKQAFVISDSTALPDRQVSRSNLESPSQTEHSFDSSEVVSDNRIKPVSPWSGQTGQLSTIISDIPVERPAVTSSQDNSSSTGPTMGLYQQINGTRTRLRLDADAPAHSNIVTNTSQLVDREGGSQTPKSSSMAFVDMLTHHTLPLTTEVSNLPQDVPRPTTPVQREQQIYIENPYAQHKGEPVLFTNEIMDTTTLQRNEIQRNSTAVTPDISSLPNTHKPIYGSAEAPPPLKVRKSESSFAKPKDGESSLNPSSAVSANDGAGLVQKSAVRADGGQETAIREPFRAVSGNTQSAGAGVARIRLGDDTIVPDVKTLESVPTNETARERNKRSVSFEPSVLQSKTLAAGAPESLKLRTGATDLATYMDPESFGSENRLEDSSESQKRTPTLTILRAPPLPLEHKEAIAAASRASSLRGSMPLEHKEAIAAASRASSLRGSMPPPPVPSSGWRTDSSSNRPRTPSGAGSQSPIKSGTAPRNRNSPPSRGDHVSMSSFASEIDDSFNVNGPKHASTSPVQGFEMNASTDPRMIQAITQTMIGENLWKYTRKTGRTEHSENRHRRFFWIHPYTRMLYWSNQDPSRSGKSELKAKSVPIEAVRVVSDDNSVPPGLHPKSIIVVTPGRNIKFTAPTSQRHEIWFNALSYLLLRNTSSGRRDDLEAAHEHQQGGSTTTRSTSSTGQHRRTNTLSSIPSIDSDDLADFNPATSATQGTSSSRASHPASGTVITRNGTEASSSKSDQASTRPQTTGQISTMSTTVNIDDEGFKKPELPPAKDGRTNSMRGRLGSLTSRISNPFGRASSKSRTGEGVADSYMQGSQAVPQTQTQLQHHDAATTAAPAPDVSKGTLENVRACCDGKHDVANLTHHAHYQRGSSNSRLSSLTAASVRSRVA